MGLRKLGRVETRGRGLSASDLWGSDYPFGTAITTSGVSVTQENALRCTAIFAAVNLIANSVAMLPVGQFIRQNGARKPLYPRPLWLDDPEGDGTGLQSFLKRWLVSKLISHAACVLILRDGSGGVVGLTVLDPRRVQRKRNDQQAIYYLIDGTTPVANEDMIYDSELIPAGALMGVSRVDTLRETFGLSQALESFAASFFGNGAHTTGVIEMADATPQQAREVQDAWNAAHQGVGKANKTGVLAGGSWKKTSTDPDEAQMIESREFAIGDVARAFQIPPTMLGSTKAGTQGYASREQDAEQFKTFTLMQYVKGVEDHLSRLLPNPAAFIRMNMDGLTRASLTDRYAAHSSAVQAGWTKINEVRTLEDLPPVDGGDELRVPLTNVPMSANAITAQQMTVEMTKTLYEAGYDPAAILKYLGLPSIAHTGLPSVQTQQPKDPKGTP